MKMALKSKFIYKMKRTIFSLFLLSTLLSSCNSPLDRKIYCFDSLMEIRLNEGTKEDLDNIEKIFTTYDKLSDNYKARDINNIYSINQSNEEIKIDEKLYNLLKISAEVPHFGANNFSFLCGSLAKKWKESLQDKVVLNNEIIAKELSKIQTSEIIFKENNIVQRIGEAEIDLGAIAKGYTLDKIKEYLDSKQYSKYLISAGFSSILLGEKDSDDGLYSIGIKNTDYYFKAKNCFVSTSGILEQSETIDGITYSHIVNPNTGSAISNYDTVLVISGSGYIGDALSTSFMMASVDEIKEVEKQVSIKVAAIKDKKIVYKSDSFEVFQ